MNDKPGPTNAPISPKKRFPKASFGASRTGCPSGEDIFASAKKQWFCLPLNIQIGDIQRVVLNKLASWLDNIAHQFGENIVGIICFVDAHLQ